MSRFVPTIVAVVAAALSGADAAADDIKKSDTIKSLEGRSVEVRPGRVTATCALSMSAWSIRPSRSARAGSSGRARTWRATVTARSWTSSRTIRS